MPIDAAGDLETALQVLVVVKRDHNLSITVPIAGKEDLGQAGTIDADHGTARTEDFDDAF
jgi:hypothetical protein